MDEETIEMPLTPQIIESNGSLRRNLLTPEVAEPKDGSLKQSSTGRIRTSISGEKVIPHYLRASTGSCHDSCKYGGHHTFEEKEKHLIRKGTRTSSSSPDGQHPIVSVGRLQMRKKKPSVKLTSPDPGIQSCDTPEINQHSFEVEEKHPIPKEMKTISSASPQRIKKKPSVKLPSPDPTTKSHDTLEATHQAFEVEEKPSILKRTKTTSSVGQHTIVSHLQRRKNKPSVKLPSPDSTTKSHDTLEATQQAFEVKEKHSILRSTNTKPFQGQPTMVSHVRTREKKPSLKLTSADPGSRVTLELNQEETKIINQKALSSAKNVANVAKSSVAFKPRRAKEKFPSPLNPPKDQSVRRESSVKVGRTADTSNVGQKKDRVLQKTTSYPKPSLNRIASLNTKRNPLSKDASTLKDDNKTKQDEFKLPVDENVSENKTKQDEFKLPVDENISEMIVLVTESKPESNSLELDLIKDLACVSPPSTVSSSLPSTSASPPSLALHGEESETDSENDETEHQNQLGKTSKEHRKARRAATVFPEDDDPGHKLKFRRGSLNTKRNPLSKDASPLKDDNKTKQDEFKLPVDENISEMIVHVTESKPESNNLELDLIENHACVSPPLTVSSSLPSTSASPPSLALHGEEYAESEYTETETVSEYDESETDSEYDETEHQNQLGKTSKEHRRARRAATVFPEDDDPGHKLKFRRGRVIDLQSVNNTPQRLRFKKGRVLGDDRNGKGGVRRKNLRKMEGNDLPDTMGVHESEKVVLRHQDVDGKKDAQGLFNNVIEETASKLAETRKSKVKALVGAFETVISLQESKPSATSHL